MLTHGHADAAQLPDLLRQPEGDITSLTVGGAYDDDPIHQAPAARQLGRPPDVVIPPRSPAVLSMADPDQQSPGDHIRLIAEHGRVAWQHMTGHGRRNAVETTFARYKHLIAPGSAPEALLLKPLRSRSPSGCSTA